MTEFLIRRFVENPKGAAGSAGPQQGKDRGAYGRLAGVVGLLCNLLLCGGKFLVGLFSGSVSITADAVNNLSDASSCLITLVGFKLGGKPADREHPFGHARLEYLSGLSVAVLIMAIGVQLLQTSIGRIAHPQPVSFSLPGAAVLLVSVLVKLWMAAFYRSIGSRIDSTALQATGIDSRNDALSTAAVLLAALVARQTGLALDGWMGLAVAAFILWGGVGIVRETMDPLLGAAPDPQLAARISRRVLAHAGALGLHDLMVHDYGPGRRFASVHVEVSAGEDMMRSHDMVDNIEREVLAEEGVHLVIHMDPISTDDNEINRHRALAAEKVRQIDPRLTIHDFRMAKGEDHTNLIFDVVVPVGFPMAATALQQEISRRLIRDDPRHFAVVTVDYNYAAGLD